MKERPILFSDAMVRAILDGRKTQTRRVVKLPENAREVKYWTTPTGRSQPGWADPGVNYWTPDPSGETSSNHIDPCPYGQPGDRLWVRESFNWSTNELLLPGEPHQHCPERAVYAAQNVVWRADGSRTHPDYGKALWLPSIHMPRWASRILLEITNVRVERVQEIGISDCLAEGIPDTSSDYHAGLYNRTTVENFIHLWDSINASRGYGWDVNPWVWVIEFRRIV